MTPWYTSQPLASESDQHLSKRWQLFCHNSMTLTLFRGFSLPKNWRLQGKSTVFQQEIHLTFFHGHVSFWGILLLIWSRLYVWNVHGYPFFVRLFSYCFQLVLKMPIFRNQIYSVRGPFQISHHCNKEDSYSKPQTSTVQQPLTGPWKLRKIFSGRVFLIST